MIQACVIYLAVRFWQAGVNLIFEYQKNPQRPFLIISVWHNHAYMSNMAGKAKILKKLATVQHHKICFNNFSFNISMAF